MGVSLAVEFREKFGEQIVEILRLRIIFAAILSFWADDPRVRKFSRTNMIVSSIATKTRKKRKNPSRRPQTTHEGIRPVQEGEHEREKLELTIAMSHAPHVPCCTLLLLLTTMIMRWGSGVRATGVPYLEEPMRSGPHRAL